VCGETVDFPTHVFVLLIVVNTEWSGEFIEWLWKYSEWGPELTRMNA